MGPKGRSLRIDITQDLPRRARPLAPDDTARIFGGCLGEWQTCSQNSQCCTYKCRRMWWHSAERYWEYQCVPASAP